MERNSQQTHSCVDFKEELQICNMSIIFWIVVILLLTYLFNSCYYSLIVTKGINNMSEAKLKALQSVIANIEKQFGKGSIMQFDPQAPIPQIPAYSTGSLSLDEALGIGGVPKGRIIEIYGPESSGKTTLTLQIVAAAQKQGDIAAFIDAEHALDVQYAAKLGVNLSELLISQPDTGEQALSIVEKLVESGAVNLIVVDSVAALVPKAEIEGDMGDSHVGLQARLMSQALRKLTALAQKQNCTIVFINQIRMKIGVMFGNPETTTGGNALKFYASVRLDIRRIGSIKKGDDVIGNETRVKVVKNKVAPPFKEATFEILYNEGVNRLGELIDMAVSKNIIDKSGSWFSFAGTKLGQGKENVRQFLKDNPSVLAEIETQLEAARKDCKGTTSASASSDDFED